MFCYNIKLINILARFFIYLSSYKSYGKVISF